MGLVLAGGVLGFWAAAAGLFLFGLPPLAALAVWAGSGPVAAALALSLAALRGAQRADPAASASDDRMASAA